VGDFQNIPLDAEIHMALLQYGTIALKQTEDEIKVDDKVLKKRNLVIFRIYTHQYFEEIFFISNFSMRFHIWCQPHPDHLYYPSLQDVPLNHSEHGCERKNSECPSKV
jgi:hypothetical protein